MGSKTQKTFYFMTDENSDIVTIYLGNPHELGAEAETVCSLDISLIESLKNDLETYTQTKVFNRISK